MNAVRRSPRYPFYVDAEMTDLQSHITVRARTRDLSLSGCGIEGLSDFGKGTSVRIKLTRGDIQVVAFGKVVYARQDLGTGIVFTSIDPTHQSVLAQWIKELGETEGHG